MPAYELSATVPFVSIVIPCFNQANYLMESVSSAHAAYEGNLEILVVDDGSTAPNSARYLRDVSRNFPTVRVISQENGGLSSARNRGIKEARGEYIQLLDADDVLLPGKITRQVIHFQVCDELDISICNYFLGDEWLVNFSKQDEGISQFDLTLEDFLFKWERGFSIPIHCALFQRRIFDTVDFDIESCAKEDWQFWCMLALLKRKMAYIHFPGVIYRQHAQSMRRSYLNMGRSWVKAAIKLDEKVNATYPLFFDAAMSWFIQYYQSLQAYQTEICELREAAKTQRLPVLNPHQLKTPQAIQELLVAKLQCLATVNESPLITVIIPIFNHYNYLEECLSSLGVQGSVSFEVICVEDYSTDDRVRQLMMGLSGKLNNLRIIAHQRNIGILLSQDEAIVQARGKFIVFLDCDDVLIEGALEKIAEEISTYPEVDYFFSDRLDISESGSLIRRASYGGYEHIVPSNNIRDDLLDGMIASHLKVIRRISYLQIGVNNLRFDGIQDWEIALKISDRGGVFKHITEALYMHRIHAQSLTHSSIVLQMQKTNNLRRYFLEKRLRIPSRGGVYEPGLEETILYSNLDRVTLPKLKETWRLGKRCVLRLTSKPPISQLNFIREFNSYFDLIEYTESETFASLIGYVWSTSILLHVPPQRSQAGK
ncbi:glycosyltransferase family 2 protein [Mycoavidus sp. SF9855]|uniref:glycosyltransferase family 2 protein n=1 Tax=Mycoavidus sp. SF9855 TaxID=2968475 RepID=UPI00211BE46F|nr:glycosyltransferase family 2 protein [Mycoavidus sp. SF9855]UUM21145.1 glycosyltransferase [Mycoavidus sp. SF9855]